MKSFVTLIFLSISCSAFASDAALDQIVDIVKSPSVVKLVSEQKKGGIFFQGIDLEAFSNCRNHNLYHINFVKFEAGKAPTHCFAEIEAGICPEYGFNVSVGEPRAFQCN